jgi:hypothetical protein
VESVKRVKIFLRLGMTQVSDAMGESEGGKSFLRLGFVVTVSITAASMSACCSIQTRAMTRKHALHNPKTKHSHQPQFIALRKDTT